ncbi:threonine tyrosine-interacting A-like [Octopus vulgaris]|uniref:Threonine tyrosine-interacting A-like n=2 Tax=Octopus TaxID=6643 RepID=A0AA36B9J7_OCTVU|nr:serine/threonine/tyrosine-interacting protein isoform X1 [Octopus sinensis]CAI9730405.1 threonine tyrosine-interacting A-like [Octopus vulgaris]
MTDTACPLLTILDENDRDVDWSYSMRREMQEIVPGLFLGPYAAAMKNKYETLKKHGITHIVCIRQDVEARFIRPNFLQHFVYLLLNIADKPTENIIQHFKKVKDFLDDCFRQGGRALVHGNAGISRSAAMVIAFIMERYSLSYRQASSHVQLRRFCINPNEGFVRQLMEFEPIYRARMSQMNGQRSAEIGPLKRKYED